MSKLFVDRFIGCYPTIDIEEIKALEFKIPARIRYVSKTKEFHIKCFDVISYLKFGDECQADFKVKENVFLSQQLFKIDKNLVSDDSRERDLPHEMIRGIEKGEDLYDDEHINICFFQKFYYFTPRIVKQIVKSAHLNRLKRIPSAWVSLTPYTYEKHGGRPFGSVNKIPDEERENLLENLERYDAIVNKIASSDVSLEKFVYMHKQLAKLGRELPPFLQKSFMRSETGLFWYWCSLRYKYCKKHNLPSLISLDDIVKNQEKYGFPWVPC